MFMQKKTLNGISFYCIVRFNDFLQNGNRLDKVCLKPFAQY